MCECTPGPWRVARGFNARAGLIDSRQANERWQTAQAKEGSICLLISDYTGKMYVWLTAAATVKHRKMWL